MSSFEPTVTRHFREGYLTFDNFVLENLPLTGAVIRRSTYMLAGTAVAIRVTGDPDGNDGLHYLYSDHLGSASAMQKDDGSAPIITRYLPFGGYRAGSGTNEVTDRGFTGQPENMDLGLYYYQARFYVPGIGRFASADSIVPDPQNPQQYNRYTYTLNNPLRFVDPTGHCAENGDEACWSLAETIWANHGNLNADKLSLDFLGAQNYLWLSLLKSILEADLLESYSGTDENLDYVETVIILMSNSENLFKPLQLPDNLSLEDQEKFNSILKAMAQVYQDNGIELAKIKTANNPLTPNDFLEPGMTEVLRMSFQNFEQSLFLEKLGLERSHFTNYEPNYFDQLVRKNSFMALEVRKELIIRAIPVFGGDVLRQMFTPSIFSVDIAN